MINNSHNLCDPDEYLIYNPLFDYKNVYINLYLESYYKQDKIRDLCELLFTKIPDTPSFELKIIRTTIYSPISNSSKYKNKDKNKGICFFFSYNSNISNSYMINIPSDKVKYEIYSNFDITFIYFLVYHHKIKITHFPKKSTKVKLTTTYLNNINKYFTINYSDYFITTLDTIKFIKSS